MTISILTLFPEMFLGPFNHSIVKRAQNHNIVTIALKNIRDYGIGKHLVVDDKPYGGGTGMIMRVDVLDSAITAIKSTKIKPEKQKTILFDARGKTFTQKKAKELSHLDHLILLCGHYEGVDERVRNLIDEELSIGDFIVTGGEIPAMLVTDAVIRLLPRVLKEDATTYDSFSLKLNNQNLLEFPQYTFPQIYKGMTVPEVLISGNHKKIKEWRENNAKDITQKFRPDLIKNGL